LIKRGDILPGFHGLSISEMRAKFQFLDGDMKIVDIPTLLW